ncbi:cohesin domain-containing protein [Microbacterium sp. Leaf320]|uniref:cohesin domain-containing protein n=1 Tax=Microbacterium sp. Leaf320 TaxID=1736334 RepID=UPI0009EB4692|nr:cohesin domain-containing protein [Microbacterium sp. Leaf320]
MPENPPARSRRARVLTAGAALAASTLLVFGVASPASAVVVPVAYDTVALTAAPTSVSVGDTVTVTAVFTGLVDAYAYELDIAYDPDLLAFVADSQILPSGGFGSAADTGAQIAVAATRLGTSPGLAGTQTLVTLRFTALEPGDASLAIASGRIVDSNAQPTTVDPNAAGTSAIVEISGEDGSEPGSGDDGSAGADPGTGGGSGSGSTSDGSLAVTGADAAPWLILGAGAIAAIAAGTVIAVRRRTR